MYYTDINVSYIPSLTDDVLLQLKPHSEYLTSLRIAFEFVFDYIKNRHTSVTDQGMIDFIQNCPHLEVLDMSNSTLLTDQSLQVLSTCILYLIVIIIQ